LDDRVNNVGLAALVDLLLQETVDLFDAFAGGVLRDDRLAAGRQLVNYADVEIAVHGHGERTGDGGRGHDEDVGRDALLDQAKALEDAESMLLIDDGEAQLLELDVLFEQGMGTYDDGREALGDELLE